MEQIPVATKLNKELMHKFDVLCKRLDCDSCPCCELKVCNQATDELTDADYAEAIKAFEDAGYTAAVVDMVNHPAHYEKYSIECIDAMRETQGVEATKQFCICNAFKYLWRHNAKNGDEDIKKASWYLNKAVSLMEGEST